MGEALNLKTFEERLLQERSECELTISSMEDEARMASEMDVPDSVDLATTEEITSETLQEAGIVVERLKLVDDALQRIHDGRFGKCLACGKQIESARLEALPWAQYCIADQEKKDRSKALRKGSTL